MIIANGNNIALELRGRVGYGEGIGYMTLGRSGIGSDSGILGTYQIRKRRNGEKIQIIAADMSSGNPRTPKQQANRNKFKAAMKDWQELSAEEKSDWRRHAKGRKENGMNLYIKSRMLDL